MEVSMKIDSRIYVAGHKGLVGSAIVRCLEASGYKNIVERSRRELDLTRQFEVEGFFRDEKPEYVFLAAAKVGGIWANASYPADFIYSNLAIQTNVIHAALQSKVSRLIFLGSSCIYPRKCPQPMKEEYLLTGPLEATNEAYAIAKIAGLIQCESCNRQYGTRFLSVMPTNLYGRNDNYDLETSHVLPALIRKFHLAKLATEGNWQAMRADEKAYGPIPEELSTNLNAIADSQANQISKPISAHCSLLTPKIQLWGSGSPRREFLHVDDLANACVFLMNLDDEAYSRLVNNAQRPIINIGFGEDITIKDLADLTAEIVGYRGEIAWDRRKPDGMPRKLLDVSGLKNLGWAPRITLREGIKLTYEDYSRSSGASLRSIVG